MLPTPTFQSVAMKQLKRQAYVDIPLSPFPLSRYSAISKPNTAPHMHHGVSSVVSSGLLKENTPLIPFRSNAVKDEPTFRKRKLSGRDPATLGFSGVTKKRKLTRDGIQEKSPEHLPVLSHLAATDPVKYANGSLYCHQCARKYDAAVSIQCTMNIISTTRDGTTKERRCGRKFCGKCLKSRYGENIEEIQNANNGKQEQGHIHSTSYTFKCPKCRGICNCRICRRSKGLEPTGKLNRPIASESGSLQILSDEPKANNPKAKFGGSNVSRNAATRKEMGINKEPVVKNKKTKPIAPIVWTSISSNLNLDQAEMRFQIREFTLRFSCIMEPTISKTHLEELDGICGSSRSLEDIEDWVSETCVRAILLGVLSLLVDKDTHHIERPIKTAIKDIRLSGANLNKMWLALSSLRKFQVPTLYAPSSSKEGTALTFPDPLPPPSTSIHVTRNLRNHGAVSPQVLISAQMVPVLNALVEAAFITDSVRTELENGVREGRQIIREVKEDLKKEHDEWDTERKRIEATQDRPKGLSNEIRLKRESHKQRIQNLENALKVVLSGLAPRFAPLGHDKAGRVFYALSPGVTERKAALDFVTAKHKKKGKAPDKKGMIKGWPYFIGVWGKRPINETQPDEERAVIHVFNREGNSDDLVAGNSENEEDAENWWGLYQPKDILNVAEWIVTSLGTADEAPKNSHSSLVKNLRDYATLLEWRFQEDKYEVGNTNQL